jgi:hypothetical protein
LREVSEGNTRSFPVFISNTFLESPLGGTGNYSSEKKRKDEFGNFVEFSGGTPVPIIDIKAPFYTALETAVLQEASDIIEKAVTDHDDRHSK